MSSFINKVHKLSFRARAHYRCFSAAPPPPAPSCIDVHTHCYLPRYVELLKSRQEIPRIVVNDRNENRLVILPSDDAISNNRKIGGEYFDVNSKVQFMDKHGISASVVSLANPWLDFLSEDRTASVRTANLLNTDFHEMCDDSKGRLFAFGLLPNHSEKGSNIRDCLNEIEHISSSPHIKGIIVGAHGIFGRGLDDAECTEIYQCLAERGLFVFVHPHYGVGNEYYDDYGHALHLALGFTFETTVAVSRFILSGILDRVPSLKLILAHCGGTLPFLCGRLDYCFNHDAQLLESRRLKKSPIDYVRSGDNLYFDGITFEGNALMNAVSLVGDQRIMFGTDHPFFPPHGFDAENNNDLQWTSTAKNQAIVQELQCPDAVKQNIFSGTAKRLFAIESVADPLAC